MQRAGRPRASSSPASNEDDYEATLAALLAAPPDAVPSVARASHPVAFTLPFLQWLADSGEPAVERVGAALTVAREGLDDAGWAEFQASLDAVGGVAALTDGGNDMAAAVAARWAALGVARSAAGALSPAALRSGALAAAGLGADLADRKAASARELMGRVRLSGEAAARAVAQAAVGDASHRILALLLDVADREERLTLLPEAFDAGDPSAPPPTADPDAEQVWTTPMKLVAAIDLALARLAEAGGGGGTRAALPGACAAAPGGGQDLAGVLQDLRAAALDYMEDE